MMRIMTQGMLEMLRIYGDREKGLARDIMRQPSTFRHRRRGGPPYHGARRGLMMASLPRIRAVPFSRPAAAGRPGLIPGIIPPGRRFFA